MESCDPAQQRHVLAGNPEVTAAHPSIAQERWKNGDDCTDRHRKAEPLPSRNDRGVDADNRTITGHQWAAGVSRIQRRIGLNDLVNQSTGARSQGASEGTDDPSRDRMVKPIWIADRNHELTGAQRPRITEA